MFPLKNSRKTTKNLLRHRAVKQQEQYEKQFSSKVLTGSGPKIRGVVFFSRTAHKQMAAHSGRSLFSNRLRVRTSVCIGKLA
jgi:hypothetical protein